MADRRGRDPGIAIRPAQNRDIDALARLAAETYREAFGQSMPAEDLETDISRSRSRGYFESVLGDVDVLIAEDDGRLVGYVQFGDVKLPIERDFRAPRDQYLERLYIAADRQRQGIGRTLLRAALAHPRLAAAENVYLNVWSKNGPAIRLYEDAGFRVVDQFIWILPSGDPGDPELVMLRHRQPRRDMEGRET